MSGLFGGLNSASTSMGSSMNGGNINVAPQGQQWIQNAIGQIGGLSTELQDALTAYKQQTAPAAQQYQSLYGNASGLYNQLASNQNPFVQAQINPMAQTIAQNEAATTQGLAQRGMLGSSFGEQELTNMRNADQMALGNATASALQNQLGAQGNAISLMGGLTQNEAALAQNQLGANQSTVNDIAGLYGRMMSGGQALTQDELAALQVAIKNRQNQMGMIGQGLGMLGNINWSSLGSDIGGILKIFGGTGTASGATSGATDWLSTAGATDIASTAALA